jgi:hypothetical protein
MLIIPATQEAEIRRIKVQGQPNLILTNNLGVVACICDSSKVGDKDSWLAVQEAHLDKSMRPYLKK